MNTHNTLDTLYFPETVLSQAQQLRLALFFHTIHLLQPVEEDDLSAQCISSVSGSYPFMEKRFCQVHTPARLGADRSRFLHLLHDIKNRKDNYVEQLSYLSLASLSERTHGGEPSQQAIISSLLHAAGQSEVNHSEREQLDLWQARLVLSIAEILDKEEEELAQQMAAIDDREIALFRSLQGEIRESGEENEVAEDPFQELLELRQKMNQPRPGVRKNRLRAWGRLYLAGPLPEDIVIWTARGQEVADILLERYEKESGCPPVAVLRVELPAQLSSDLNTAVAAVQSFRAESQFQMQKVAEAISMLVAGQATATDDPAVILPHAEKWREEWDARLESFFPANQYGRVSLTIYLLAGMPLPVLIGRAPDAQASRVVNGLLAVF